MQIIWELSVADLNGSEYFFVLDSEKDKFRETVANFISLGVPVILRTQKQCRLV